MNAMRRMLDAVEEREIRRIALSRSSITFAAAFMIERQRRDVEAVHVHAEGFLREVLATEYGWKR
jgi:hypothetical protein